ncbi:bifunctional P-450/NADPH-P450 reductase [Phanerochaete sordida]|uniref:Bifunctional P-450/NADPH-P450 reductase n=1 Tax=Phanerochaete sordida TaxID=48140 RepID=A0A9P3G9N6_9APHY|nr:bifunctional P-450/NADPH-P450 reductase [Phanerochaete sordida]
MTTPIPSPPSVPFLGHVTIIDREVAIYSYNLLAKQYGEIYTLNMLGSKVVVVCSQELLHEVSDEKRFRKIPRAALDQVRNAVGDGLFTAHGEEPNWHIAHRILMPAFSTMNTRNMFDDMVDVISQLVQKWERFGPRHRIDPSQDFTALTFEAITFCAMSYRMNSFYVEGMHPFARAMADFLIESGNRALRPGIVQPFLRGTNSKYEEDVKVMSKYVDDIYDQRKANPTEKKDILNLMMNGKDPVSGEGMSEQLIKNNLLTFLIAGHETTSGMLTFIMYYLLKNPEAMRKLREEVDTMIGSRLMTVDDVNKLPYLIAVMREALRLGPPAPMRGTAAFEDTTLKGKYAVQKDVPIYCGIYMVHRDPKVYGEDADEFRPERMLDGKFEALPPDAWQPFGFGVRACIGRPFAWQEAQITLVYLMQRFTFVMHDPTYDLHLKQTLTIKPHDFYIHAIPRTDKPSIVPIPTPSSTLLRDQMTADKHVTQEHISDTKTPAYVLYGSNTGTCEAFAQRVASDAAAHGFKATIGTLDSAAGHLPTDGPVIIVTASFEGQPADNAAHFISWLTSLEDSALANVSFAVFGCGNRDWASTYQRIPTLCDDTLAARGASRIVARGAGDAGSGDLFEAFEHWEAGLWEALQKAYGTTKAEGPKEAITIATVDAGTARATALRQSDTILGTVLENKVLTSPGTAEKRHIEFQLPEGLTFRTGDYLAILPMNPQRDVQRALAHFGLLPDQEVKIESVGPSPLPTGRPINVTSLLSGYVELSQPATTRDLQTLAEATKSEDAKTALKHMLDNYAEAVQAKRMSVLDILEEHTSISISFALFLQLLPSMRVRQYSISSSPLADAQRVSLTISVLEAPAISGRREPFLGVASHYLAGLRPNDKVQLAVRPSNAAFHPPADPAVPLVMFCAGSGLAPMRGFLQERAAQKQAGRDVAKSILFFGCRGPQQDFLYIDSDLKAWTELGIVDVRPAFSRDAEQSGGCKYVQDRVWADREDVVGFWKAGAKMYVCGSGRMATAVKEKLVEIVQVERNMEPEKATETFNEIIKGRFATDVFE